MHMGSPDPLASLGPFFAVQTHADPPSPPWRRMSELSTDAAALGTRIAQVRAALAASRPGREVEVRVAASVTQLGLTARLVAPVIALASLGALVAPLHLDDVYWQAVLGRPFPLSLPEELQSVGPPGSGQAALVEALLEGPIRELVDATRAQQSVAPRVLWGNVASTVHAAGQQLSAARPDLAAPAADVVRQALAHPLLRSLHERRQGRFRRRSCCLLYRVDAAARPGTVCSDCILVP